ncbi:AzlC family ABC transporter permease [Stenotrophomonas sp. AB1(2024)]|uniref:AzlC family ABC transporter permease n=1 Tax=Stenotrophomonas sp. AB1(2024) TaxID=3132215 RepID=UPI0030B270C4
MKAAALKGLCGGVVTSVSIAVGYIPIGFSFGVAAIQAGVPADMAVLISLVVYAGASQFVLISLITSGAGLLTAIPTVLLMNARHALYGPAVVAAASGGSGRLASPWLAFGLTDEVLATAISRMSSVPQDQRDHWLLGLQAGAFVAWVGGTVLGVVFVRVVDLWPAAVREGLGFVLPALFLSLLMETGLRRWHVPIVAAAGTALLSGSFMASHHALALSIVVGALGHALATRGPR